MSDYAIQGMHATAKSVLNSWCHLFKFFGKRTPASEITFERLMEYAAWSLEKRAAATVAKELTCLSKGFRILERAGKLRRPPFPTIRINNARQGFFEDEQLESVLKHLAEDLHPIVRFLSLTGWRFEEAQGLKWSQVDFQGGVVRLEPGTTKNLDGRIFPFSALPPLKAILEEQRARTTSLEVTTAQIIPWVFWRGASKQRPDLRPGRQVGRFTEEWTRATVKAGLPGWVLHDARRGAARRMERAGVPRSVAMKLLGHRTESMYRRYCISNERDLAEGVEKIAAYLRRDKGLRESI
jgi:integrase